MGFLDKIKGQAVTLKDMAVDTAVKNSDKISGGLDKAGEFADKQTKGKYTDKIQTGKVKAKQGLEKLEAKNASSGGSSSVPPASTEMFGTTPSTPPSSETFGTTPPATSAETFGTAEPAYPAQAGDVGTEPTSPLHTPDTTSDPAADPSGTPPRRTSDDPEATPPPLS